ncbi:hypothetical protein PGTUg99_010524 [Puccinia graminis f. sp. tritici]|uniref:Uncharacterized protein n=1 Tax=Puccinia graminis f. sp. tritici TaxID=56615 RepID=A0A5B0QG52_PUCGR|nr:hypothetical protein PGTUg99_010524 [Puccinia graminis f. sp. tritici]
MPSAVLSRILNGHQPVTIEHLTIVKDFTVLMFTELCLPLHPVQALEVQHIYNATEERTTHFNHFRDHETAAFFGVKACQAVPARIRSSVQQ